MGLIERAAWRAPVCRARPPCVSNVIGFPAARAAGIPSHNQLSSSLQLGRNPHMISRREAVTMILPAIAIILIVAATSVRMLAADASSEPGPKRTTASGLTIIDVQV